MSAPGPLAGRPLVVVEGTAERATRECEALRTAGWSLVEGFADDPASERTIVRVGPVRDERQAAAVVLAVLRGAGVVVHASGGRVLTDRLVDDLRRFGPVRHVTDTDPAPAPGAGGLDPKARTILGLLAEGYSLGEAAALLGLPRRTADRKLAAARRTLRVERTTEAVAQARRLGWLSGPTR